MLFTRPVVHVKVPVLRLWYSRRSENRFQRKRFKMINVFENEECSWLPALERFISLTVENEVCDETLQNEILFVPLRFVKKNEQTYS